jgi:hypothetical protein
MKSHMPSAAVVPRTTADQSEHLWMMLTGNWLPQLQNFSRILTHLQSETLDLFTLVRTLQEVWVIKGHQLSCFRTLKTHPWCTPSASKILIATLKLRAIQFNISKLFMSSPPRSTGAEVMTKNLEVWYNFKQHLWARQGVGKIWAPLTYVSRTISPHVSSSSTSRKLSTTYRPSLSVLMWGSLQSKRKTTSTS